MKNLIDINLSDVMQLLMAQTRAIDKRLIAAGFLIIGPKDTNKDTNKDTEIKELFERLTQDVDMLCANINQLNDAIRNKKDTRQ